jgi:NAD(P)-dependent dehydrogenase (short-subunit alcohol dehydrogenase family)
MYGVQAPDLSIYDREEDRNPPYYGAAKAALIQLTRYAAAELAPAGVRVNAVVLGPFPGQRTEANGALLDRIAARTLLGRIGSPDEIGGAVLYLASRASSFTTGSVLTVDGGWTAH